MILQNATEIAYEILAELVTFQIDLENLVLAHFLVVDYEVQNFSCITIYIFGKKWFDIQGLCDWDVQSKMTFIGVIEVILRTKAVICEQILVVSLAIAVPGLRLCQHGSPLIIYKAKVSTRLAVFDFFLLIFLHQNLRHLIQNIVVKEKHQFIAIHWFSFFFENLGGDCVVFKLWNVFHSIKRVLYLL